MVAFNVKQSKLSFYFIVFIFDHLTKKKKIFFKRNITQNASGTQKCIVFLHQKPFTSGSGFNTKEARKEAATRACELLQDPQLLPLLCTCKSSSKDF